MISHIICENYTIQHMGNNLFQTTFYYPCQTLIESVVKSNLILGATVFSDYTGFQFKANSVKKFNSFWQERNKISDFYVLADMIRCLATQLSFLKNKTFLGLHLQNLLVIDDTTWIYLADEYLLDIRSDNLIEVNLPFCSHDFYMAPELYSIRQLPALVPYQVTYYSIGCLLIHASNEMNKEEQEEEQEPKDILEKVYWKNTKMYWLIKRCLEINSNKRHLFFI